MENYIKEKKPPKVKYNVPVPTSLLPYLQIAELKHSVIGAHQLTGWVNISLEIDADPVLGGYDIAAIIQCTIQTRQDIENRFFEKVRLSNHSKTVAA